jgi:hypothetical protein
MNAKGTIYQMNTQPDGNSAQNAMDESPLPDSLYLLKTENASFEETVIRCEKEKVRTVQQWFVVHALNAQTHLPEMTKRVLMCTHCGNITVKQA